MFLIDPQAIESQLEPAMFQELSNLKLLSISGHWDLRRIMRGTFNSLINIETIEFIDCGICEIEPEAFKSLPKLRFLSLELNYLTKFSFKDVPSDLEHLDLSHNKIELIDFDSMRIKQRLTMLDLKDNCLKSLPENSFLGFCALRVLDLSMNELKELSSDAFAGLVNLRELGLAWTGRKSIRARVFSSMLNLTRLNLCNTRLDSIDESAFSGLRGVVRVSLNEHSSTRKVLRPFEKQNKVKTNAF
jgi:Leucine-rich repeat (LRR) protein